MKLEICTFPVTDITLGSKMGSLRNAGQLEYDYRQAKCPELPLLTAAA